MMASVGPTRGHADNIAGLLKVAATIGSPRAVPILAQAANAVPHRGRRYVCWPTLPIPTHLERLFRLFASQLASPRARDPDPFTYGRSPDTDVSGRLHHGSSPPHC